MIAKRVRFQDIPNSISELAMIIGRVVSLDYDSVQVINNNDNNLKQKINIQNAELKHSKIDKGSLVEIIGRVVNESTIMCEKIYIVPDNKFNFELFDEVITIFNNNK